MDFSGSVQGPGTRCCEHGTEPPISVNGVVYLDKLTYFQPLKTGSDPWGLLFKCRVTTVEINAPGCRDILCMSERRVEIIVSNCVDTFVSYFSFAEYAHIRLIFQEIFITG